MNYLIVYDISSDRIRTKIADQLVAHSYDRLQLSVFSGLYHPRHFPQLWENIRRLLADEPEAKFFVIPLPDSSLRDMTVLGQYRPDIDYLTGDKDSMFF